MSNMEGKRNRQLGYASALKKQEGVPVLMGVLNATPDSFYEESRVEHIDMAIHKGLQMWDEGATWIDVGGESTRPGADEVTVLEEIERVIPIIEELRRHRPNGLISIDTRHVETARAALEAGADMVNDVTGLRNPEMVDLVVDHQCPVCIMHMLGEPKTMQSIVEYSDVVKEVSFEIGQRVEELLLRGFPIENIVVDPGIGFGKLTEHNVELLQAGQSFSPQPEISLLWGVSRKSIIGALTGQESPQHRLAGTLGVAAFAMLKGIDILRVHDVKEHADLFSVLSTLQGHSRHPPR